ncbi:MAG: DNA polymerase III subunit alpha [Bacteroidales bacterium]|nr:DNA polymerase III subunit alpha [Bacteroidales bacterium]
MSGFVHLHVHTQYSILDGASNIKILIERAKELNMKAVAITDHGNMFGVKEFINTVEKKNDPVNAEIKRVKCELDGIIQSENPEKFDELTKQLQSEKSKLFKPIIGCEAYIAKNSRFDRTDKDDRGGYHLILLAKNNEGYHNLVKLVSYSWTEGFYYKPRMDKELLRKYSKGIIASSACLGGEIPQAILAGNIDHAEKLIYEYREIFGEDFYLELTLHQSGDYRIDQEVYENQLKVNKVLVDLGKKTNTKCIATNDAHFINASDAEAHDRLICLSTGKDLDDPDRLRYTTQEYIKSEEEMLGNFPDFPEAIYNTAEIANKVEIFSLSNAPIMPYFPLPEGFKDDNDYLRHLTYEGAKKRWGDNLSETVTERIEFELEVVARMGYPGYFLIVWDFIKAAREMGVSVGPGRGSAAGSAVAYCLRITDIDPIKYDLLFERFLNPERISMPDIDIDFDEDGRELVLKYVVEKYGRKRVAQIITFGTMAAKMAIRDIARVQKLPLFESDKLAKLVPERPGTTLAMAFKEVPELAAARNSENELIRDTLKYAEVLEGNVRQTGVHACGVIIGRDDLEEYIPLSTAKDADLFVTQYEGSQVEDIGLLKMDFLGLKTLSIIKDALDFIKESKGIDLDIDAIPLDDKKTFQLYSRGETTALFQFESPGMKKHLRALQPNRFEDLIAMNALYRPGPMEYIPSFINRKHGREKIEYDIPVMEEYLKDTYGITVYQEQVMLLSQKLAGFTKGQADGLRKAMGKKLIKVMNELKEKFTKGCLANGYEQEKIDKIWNDWEAFAQYAFNKSHSTCYAYISYQTAYLKANFPGEFMAAVLSRNISDIKKITIFMDECKRLGMQVLGPDVNESAYKFTVSPSGDIRFGLGAIKGVGENAVANIIEARKTNGKYKDIFDFAEKVNLQTVNKKNFEALAVAGAFDGLGSIKRSEYFALDSKGVSFIEQIMRYGSKVQIEKSNNQRSLFGASTGYDLQKPETPVGEDWSKLEKLNREKEVIGIYLSAHPLDDYRLEIDNFSNTSLTEMKDLPLLNGKDVTIAGMITSAKVATSKNGNYFGKISLEDYSDSWELALFGKDFENYRKFCFEGYSLLIKGRVQPKSYNPAELEFKIKSMNMLSDVKEEMIKMVNITIPIHDITDNLVDEIKKQVESNKGKIQLKFKVIDPESKISIDLFSRTMKVNLSPKFLNYLRSNEFEFRVRE